MITYISIFFAAEIFFFLSESINNRIYSKLCAAIGILIPSIMAGIRSNLVGTDVSVYGERFYMYASNASNMSQLKDTLSFTGEYNDILFHLLNYFLSRISTDYHLGLFVYELITISLVYYAFIRIKKVYRISVSIGMFFYFFTMYNASLNMMKQAISIAIILCAITFLIEQKYIIYFALTALAFLEHGSGLIGILIYLIFEIFKDTDRKHFNRKILYCISFMILMIVILLFNKEIVYALITHGIVKEGYLNYLSGGIYSNNTGLNIFSIMIPLFSLLDVLLLFNEIDNKVSNDLFWIGITFVGLLTSFSTLISNYLGRINYYFILPILTFQMIMFSVTKKSNRAILQAFFIFLVAIVWIHDIAIKNFNGTIPYSIG